MFTIKYMKIVMDADCLIKLTKAGAKSAVLSALKTSIPLEVKRETVDEGKKGNHPDAFIIEKNIKRGTLKPVQTSKKTQQGFVAHKGEREVVALFLGGGYDAVASDDARFLRKLEVAGIPFITAAACVVYLYVSGKVKKKRALDLLKQLRKHISDEEYSVFRLFMEENQ